MPTRTLGLGFCALGYPARLERLGLVSPVVGIRVVAPELVLELVRLLVLVFELPELVYLTVLMFELAFKSIFEPLGLISLLVDHSLELLELARFVIVVYEVVALVYPMLVALELLGFVLKRLVLVCLVVALVLEPSVLVCPSDLLVRLFSGLVFGSLIPRCVRLVTVVVGLRWVLIGLVVVRVRVVLVLVVAVAVVTVVVVLVFVPAVVVVTVLFVFPVLVVLGVGGSWPCLALFGMSVDRFSVLSCR